MSILLKCLFSAIFLTLKGAFSSSSKVTLSTKLNCGGCDVGVTPWLKQYKKGQLIWKWYVNKKVLNDESPVPSADLRLGIVEVIYPEAHV